MVIGTPLLIVPALKNPQKRPSHRLQALLTDREDHVLDIDTLTLGFGGPPVLSEARLTLTRGQRLLVCGAAGSGKTSLLSVAAGLMPRLVAVPEISGHATLDGKALGSYDRHDLFRRIGFIGQNLEISSGTSASRMSLPFRWKIGAHRAWPSAPVWRS